jgi:hypothetical protein
MFQPRRIVSHVHYNPTRSSPTRLMNNRITPSVEWEIGKHRTSDGALFIKANLADVVASLDDGDEDAAFGGEVAGDLGEKSMVVVAIEVGAESGGCDIPFGVEVVAVVHPIVVVLVLAISIVLIHAIAVVLVHAIVAVPVFTIVVVTIRTSVVVVIHAIVIIPVLTIAVVHVFVIVIFFSFVVVAIIPSVVLPIVLVLAIPIVLLLILIVVEVMVDFIPATINAVVVFVVVVVLIPAVVTRVFITIAIAIVVAGPSARELAVAIALVILGARSRAIVLAPLPLDDTGKDGLGTSHEGCVKSFALPKLGIREGDLGFLSWDKAWREIESGVGVVAFGKEVAIFGRAGIEVDEFREKGDEVVRVPRCLDQNKA